MADKPNQQKPLPPTTTGEENLVTHGQRRVNLIWEITQSTIAILVTLSTLLVASWMTIDGRVDTAAFLLLSNAFFLVIGFYFGRTNHTKQGGVGQQRRGE